MREISAYKLWKALEDKFMKKSSQNKLYMKKRLFRFTYVSSTTINNHITIFNKLVIDLQNLDMTFEDEDQALMLLGSLPDEYEHLEITLLHDKEKVSLREVYSTLYNYEQKKREKQRDEEAEVLVIRGRVENQSRSRRRRSKSKSRPNKDECVFCKEKGHWKKDYPKLKNKSKNNNGKVAMDSYVAYCDDENSDFSLSTMTSSKSSGV